MFADILHQTFLVVRVVNRKTAVVAKMINKTAQNPDAGRVKRAYPDGFRSIRNNAVDAFPHFIGSFICKGKCQNLVRGNAVFFDKIGDAVRQHAGLPGTGSG